MKKLSLLSFFFFFVFTFSATAQSTPSPVEVVQSILNGSRTVAIEDATILVRVVTPESEFLIVLGQLPEMIKSKKIEPVLLPAGNNTVKVILL